MTDILNSLNWRYATKKYDSAKRISEADLNTLKEATKLSVSSMGLQPYRILVIENPEIREKLKAAAYGQTPITDASALFVFAIETGLGDKQIDAYMNNISEVRDVPVDALAGFKDKLHGFVDNLSETESENWAKKQTYIALSTLINTASFLKIDATPMEGFNAAQFDEILGLSQLGLKTSVIATVGYRHAEDATQHNIKVRKSNTDLFINL